MSDSKIDPEIKPRSDVNQTVENRAPDAGSLIEKDQPQNPFLLSDEKLPADMRLVLWSFVFVVLLACSTFVIANQDFRQSRADAAASAPTQLATSAAATGPASPLPDIAPPAPTNPLADAQAPLPLALPSSVAEATVPSAQRGALSTTPPLLADATKPSVASSPAVEQFVSPPPPLGHAWPKHLTKAARSKAGDLCPIALAGTIRLGCNTFFHKEVPIH